MDREQALKKASDQIDSSNSSRAMYEALCGLWMAYTYGSQWADVRSGSARGGYALNQLKTIVDANRSDVRIAMNMIRPRVTKLNSRLKPRRLEFRVEAASKANNDQVAAMVANVRLTQQLENITAIRAIRLASLWRVVLGSCVVRRSMTSVGQPIIVRDEAGNPSKGPNGKERTIRTFEHNWAVCPPFEFIRDPSANTAIFDEDEVIGHEKPRTLEWLKRNYGVELQTEATMGQLLEFQKFLHDSTGQSLASGAQDSKAKAVMVSEWWFKDPDKKEKWGTWMLAYRDSRGESIEDRQLKVLQFGDNPFHGLPLHHLWYDIQLMSPWGRGVAALTQPAQDATNMAFVGMLRALTSHGCPKYLIEDGSLVDKIENALNNRVDQPIVYRRGTLNPPKRMESTQIDAVGAKILADSPDWLDSMLNMSPVQAGQAVARGESAKAYETRRDSADTPLTSITDDDELTLNELLSGTLQDILKTDSVKALREKLSHEFTLEQLLTLKSQDPADTLAGVKIVPDSLRPQTPQEMKEDFAAAVSQELVDPVAARRTLLVRGRVTFDEKESRAYYQQIREIASLLSGEPIDVYLAQDHDTHQWVISLEMESTRFGGYSDEQRNALMEHWEDHEQSKQMLLAPGMGEQSGGLPEAPMQPPMDPMQQQPMPPMPQLPPAGPMPPPMPGEGMPGGQGIPGAGLDLMAMMPGAPVGAGQMM